MREWKRFQRLKNSRMRQELLEGESKRESKREREREIDRESRREREKERME